MELGCLWRRPADTLRPLLYDRGTLPCHVMASPEITLDEKSEKKKMESVVDKTYSWYLPSVPRVFDLS